MNNHWPTKKLGELCEIQIGKTPRRGVVKYWQNGTLPWITISEINGGEVNKAEEKITEVAVKELNCKPFPRGTILYTFKLSIGRVGIAGESLFTNEAIAGFFIKNQKEILQKWLYYILPKVDYRPFLSNAVKGNTLNKSTLNLLPIPLPPLKIQKQIVERLDKIAGAQKLNDELIQKSDELFQSLLHKELQPGKNWKAQKLENLLELCDAGVWGKATKDGGMLVLRSTNFKNGGLLDFSNIPELKIDEKKRAKAELINGDILLEKSGGSPDQPVGRVVYFIAPDKRVYTFANFIQRLRFNSNLVNSNFLFYHLLRLHNVGYTKKLQSQTTGIRNLKLSLYLKTEVPLPPLKIQKQIVEKLSAAQDYKKQLLTQKSKLKEFFDSVLNKSMKGELVK